MLIMTTQMMNGNKLMTPSKADALAKELNGSDDDCSYKAKHDPKGTGASFVEIYDEDGELMGAL